MLLGLAATIAFGQIEPRLEIWDLAWSKPGSRLLASHGTDFVTELDWPSGKVVRRLKTSSATAVLRKLDVSPNGKLALCANESMDSGWTPVWDLATGKEMARIGPFFARDDSAPATTAKFSPKSDYVFGSAFLRGEFVGAWRFDASSPNGASPEFVSTFDEESVITDWLRIPGRSYCARVLEHAIEPWDIFGSPDNTDDWSFSVEMPSRILGAAVQEKSPVITWIIGDSKKPTLRVSRLFSKIADRDFALPSIDVRKVIWSADGNKVFAVGLDGKALAFSLLNGKAIWSEKVLEGRHARTILNSTDGKSVLIGGGGYSDAMGGWIEVRDAKSGALLRKVNVNN